MSGPADQVWNVPNRISMVRMVLSVVLFVLVTLGWYWLGLVTFAIAASTDWVDGWWARKYNQVTKLGRILDPLCDKILICGVFILLSEAMVGFPWYLRITGWMAVVVVGRELLVTVLRSLIEESGGDFSAKWAGKLKMWFQCIAAGACLLALAQGHGVRENSPPIWLSFALFASIWAAVISTLYSGAEYVVAAARYFAPAER
jgi:CDP-diacylglycerol--glycerol-3-phosphate 3-phosphatidyltransferase